MLFKVVSGKQVFELNPELKAIQEFSTLTDRQMAYVILSTDYRSPFRKLTPYDRKTRAAIEVGYTMESDGKRLAKPGRTVVNGGNKAVEAAVKKYRLMQKDEDYETILGMSKLIADIREFCAASNKSATEIEKAIKFSKDLPTLIKAKKEVEEILEMREEEVTDVMEVQTDEGEIKESNLSILAMLNDEEANED